MILIYMKHKTVVVLIILLFDCLLFCNVNGCFVNMCVYPFVIHNSKMYLYTYEQNKRKNIYVEMQEIHIVSVCVVH